VPLLMFLLCQHIQLGVQTPAIGTVPQLDRLPLAAEPGQLEFVV
jgi:hypothetical protein